MSMRPASLEIRVLGPLEVRVDGVPLVVDTRKALAILALLAVDGRPFARDELAALLWPESDDESARGALRRTLSVLRSSLGDRWLNIDRTSVALDRRDAEIDLDTLEAAAEAPDAATLRSAAALARGSFLAGFALRDSPEFDDWRATRGSAVERSVAVVLDRLATAAEAEGDIAGAVVGATRRVDLDPLDEPAQRRLMALLARSGDRSGAIRRYRACVAMLERELGVAPLAETTALYEAIRDERPAPRVPPSARTSEAIVTPGRLPHVGRDADVAALLAVHRAAAPDGRVAAVIGEAGIGKSRLVEAVTDDVEAAGGRILVARGYPSETGIAYGPLAELLRIGLARPDAAIRLAGLEPGTLAELSRLVELPEALVRTLPRTPTESPGGGPGATARLLEAVATAFTALTAGPPSGLVVVEDLQWADAASREALAWIARRLAGRPFVLLLTWRPEDLDELGTAFAATVEAIPGATTVMLHRLDRPAVERLVAAAVSAGMPPRDVDSLLAESEGLPLYIVEALATGASSPEGSLRSVRTLFRERLATVSETAAQVLTTGAVIGRSFGLRLVRAASGRSEDETITALEELIRRGIVREIEAPPDTAYDFAHAKLRDAAYEATGLARRRLLHRRTAELLRAEGGTREDLGRLVQIATHERAAGRDADAAEAFREAGSRARALHANREAASHFETALALGHPDVAALQLALGEARTDLGEYPGALVALEASAAVAAPSELPTVELRLARVHARRGDLSKADNHLAAAEELLYAAGPGGTAGLASVLAERALVAHRSGNAAAASRLAHRALDVARSHAAGDGPAVVARPLQVLGLVALGAGDLDAAREHLTRALAAAGASDLPVEVASRHALALVEARSGDLELAIELAGEALIDGRILGDRHAEAALENTLADLLNEAGRKDESMAHLKQAVTIFAEVGGQATGELEPEIWKLVEW